MVSLAGLCVLGAILTGCEECHTGCRYTKLNAEFVGRPGIEYAPIEQVTWTISLDGCDYKVQCGSESGEARVLTGDGAVEFDCSGFDLYAYTFPEDVSAVATSDGGWKGSATTSRDPKDSECVDCAIVLVRIELKPPRQE
jgi:hypothetical protein